MHEPGHAMTDAPAPPATSRGDAWDGFARVVCGVDGRRMGFEAARQAGRLTAPDGRSALVAVIDYLAALAGRWGPGPPDRGADPLSARGIDEALADLAARAAESLAIAAAQVASPAAPERRVVEGRVVDALLHAARTDGADLVAVGAHGGRRLVGDALAEATAVVLREAPCSVLVARHPFDPGRFPERIVVGDDGSPEAAAAMHVASGLRRRSGGTLTVVSAPRRPVEALVTAALSADLTVVGSRGLHGARALGSVSERVAFRAESSVLVVRAPDPAGP